MLVPGGRKRASGYPAWPLPCEGTLERAPLNFRFDSRVARESVLLRLWANIGISLKAG
jgi:hypothetical protein